MPFTAEDPERSEGDEESNIVKERFFGFAEFTLERSEGQSLRMTIIGGLNATSKPCSSEFKKKEKDIQKDERVLGRPFAAV